jgi:diguanylate cyclase
VRHQIDKENIAVLANKALLEMSQRKIPLYPENYFIWFNYITGADKELETEINRIIEKGGQFSEEINFDLYRKYFSNDDSRSKIIDDAQKEIQRILKDVLDEILHTQTFTSDYRNKLEAFTVQLKEVRSLDEIHKIVADLMQVTVEVIQSSEQLKALLEETTNKSENLQKELEKAQHEVLIDPLTVLYNRKAFDRKLSTCMKAFQEEGATFSVVMIDIDYFKKFNDQYGHQLGDQVLKFMGTLLSKELKGRDFVARYGGEEFVILMENTSVENAYIVADKIRKGLECIQLKYAKTGQVVGKITISAGISAVREADTLESVVKRADNSLYLAKKNGRNNVKSELDLPQGHEHEETINPSMVEFLKT